jgi:hypothetical protein
MRFVLRPVYCVYICRKGRLFKILLTVRTTRPSPRSRVYISPTFCADRSRGRLLTSSFDHLPKEAPTTMTINRSSTSSTQGSSTSALGGRQPQRVSSYRLPHDVLRKYLQRTYPGRYKLEVRSATYSSYSVRPGLSLTMLRRRGVRVDLIGVRPNWASTSSLHLMSCHR